MPGHARSHRTAARALLVVALAGGLVVGVNPAGTNAAPETVIRTVSIDATALAGRGVGRMTDGSLLARTAGRTRSRTVCSPIWFDGLAFTWDQVGGAPARLVVATGARGDFGPTRTIGADDGPDLGTAEHARGRLGSEYVWTGGARCVRVSVELRTGARISALRAVFLNTSGTPGGPGTGPTDVGPSLDERAPLPGADAMTREPDFITRKQWGANPKLMNCTPDVVRSLSVGFVHHTAGSNSYSRSQADDVVRGIYAYHTNVRGWCDIGYNFLVDRYGDVFEGRSGGVTNDVVPAAQMGFNKGAFAVAVMGTFSAVAPPSRAIVALEHLLAWRLDVAHVNPRGHARMTSTGGPTTRYKRGTTVRLHAISGHRDTGLTSCPGARLYSMLPSIRRVVARIGLPKLYAPRLSTTRVTAGEPTLIRIRAAGSRRLIWTVSVIDDGGHTVTTLPTQRGDALDLRWHRATIASPGHYRVVIEASARSGKHAMPASLPLFARRPSPSPTASPSP